MGRGEVGVFVCVCVCVCVYDFELLNQLNDTKLSYKSCVVGGQSNVALYYLLQSVLTCELLRWE